MHNNSKKEIAYVSINGRMDELRYISTAGFSSTIKERIADMCTLLTGMDLHEFQNLSYGVREVSHKKVCARRFHGKMGQRTFSSFYFL